MNVIMHNVGVIASSCWSLGPESLIGKEYVARTLVPRWVLRSEEQRGTITRLFSPNFVVLLLPSMHFFDNTSTITPPPRLSPFHLLVLSSLTSPPPLPFLQPNCSSVELLLPQITSLFSHRPSSSLHPDKVIPSQKPSPSIMTLKTITDNQMD